MKKYLKQILSFLLAAIMIVTVIPLAGLQLKASAGTNGYTADQAVQWARERLNKTVGTGQCVSLINYYYNYLGYASPYSGVNGGKDFATADSPLSVTGYTWQRIKYYNGFIAQKGDIAIWTSTSSSSGSTYGHVAIVHDADASHMYCYDQGPSYGLVVKDTTWTYGGGFWGVIRPDFASVTVPTAPSVHLSKSNLAVNETATLTWSNCSGASYYWISCWSSTYQCISEEGFNYSKQVSFSKPGKYSITVCSGNSKGEVIGNWIEINVYDSKPTVPDVRLDRSSIQSGNSVIAFWDACSNATNYNIDIWKSNTHIETLYLNADLSHSVKISSAGTYKIYVTAINNLGGSTSEPKEVKVYDAPQKPVIKSITSNPDGTVTLTWTPCNNADKYSIRFFKEGQTTEYVFLKRVTSETQYTYSLPDGNYTSFVTAENSVSHTNGDMSSTFSVKKSSYILSFDPNNGECSTLSKTVIYNSTYGSLPVPTRDGYTFDGWYTSATGGNQITADSVVAITENQILYAHWTVSCNHSYNSEVIKRPTCTEDGTAQFTCSECGDTYTETIPAFGHDYIETVTPPTCLEQGYTTHVCSWCEDTYIDNYTEPLNHPSSAWHTAINPTAASDGLAEKRCDFCGEVLDSFIIPRLIPDYATGITISSDKETVGVGDSFTLTAVVEPETATNKNIVWSSMNTRVATVNNGTVTAEKPGAAVIVAQTEDGGYKDFCFVRVISLTAINGAVIDNENGLIYGLAPHLDSVNEYLEPVDDSMSIMLSDSSVGTGTTVNVVDNGEIIDSFDAIVFGDVNGDGWYDGSDSIIVNCLANGLLTKEQVSEAVYMAADCNHDGVIDSADVAILEQAGLILAGVDQCKSPDELAEDSAYIDYISLIEQSPEQEEKTDEETVEPTLIQIIFRVIKMIVDFVLSFMK